MASRLYSHHLFYLLDLFRKALLVHRKRKYYVEWLLRRFLWKLIQFDAFFQLPLRLCVPHTSLHNGLFQHQVFRCLQGPQTKTQYFQFQPNEEISHHYTTKHTPHISLLFGQRQVFGDRRMHLDKNYILVHDSRFLIYPL